MGEIGIGRNEYLYRLKYIDLLMIHRGYDRRQRYMWSATRWQTYNIMASFSGKQALQDAGIRTITDLIRFPWEVERQPISQAEVDDLVAEINAINAKSSEE